MLLDSFDYLDPKYIYKLSKEYTNPVYHYFKTTQYESITVDSLDFLVFLSQFPKVAKTLTLDFDSCEQVSLEWFTGAIVLDNYKYDISVDSCKSIFMKVDSKITIKGHVDMFIFYYICHKGYGFGYDGLSLNDARLLTDNDGKFSGLCLVQPDKPIYADDADQVFIDHLEILIVPDVVSNLYVDSVNKLVIPKECPNTEVSQSMYESELEQMILDVCPKEIEYL